MTGLRILVRNLASNWTGYAVQILIMFFLMPFVWQTLGDARNGVWLLVSSLTGYYGLLDSGFRAGLTQYLARYLAARDYTKLNQTASTGFLALGLCGCLVLLVSVALGFTAPWFIPVPRDMVKEVRWCIWIVGAAVALQFPFFTFSAVFSAAQRFDLSNAIGIPTRLVSALAFYLVLKAGYGLLGLAVVTAVTNLVDYGLRWPIAYRILPQLSLHLGWANRASAWEFIHFGKWNVVINGSILLISKSSSLIIGNFRPLGLAAVPPFANAANVRGSFEEMFVPLGQVFFPAAAQLDAVGDTSALRRMYLGGSRFLLLLAVTAALISWFWADDFFALWIHFYTVEPGKHPSIAKLFRLLVLGSICTSGQRVGYQVLMGIRQIKLMATLFAAEGISNLVLSVCLIRWLGLEGVALGAMIPAVFFQGLLYPLVLGRLLSFSWQTYGREVWARPLCVATVMSGLLAVLRLTGPATTWRQLVLMGLISSALGFITITLVGLNKKERRRFLWEPLALLFRLVLPRPRVLRFPRILETEPKTNGSFEKPTVSQSGNARPMPWSEAVKQKEELL